MVVNENIIYERLSMPFLNSTEQVANSDRRCGRNLDKKHPSWKAVYWQASPVLFLKMEERGHIK